MLAEVNCKVDGYASSYQPEDEDENPKNDGTVAYHALVLISEAEIRAVSFTTVWYATVCPDLYGRKCSSPED